MLSALTLSSGFNAHTGSGPGDAMLIVLAPIAFVLGSGQAVVNLGKELGASLYIARHNEGDRFPSIPEHGVSQIAGEKHEWWVKDIKPVEVFGLNENSCAGSIARADSGTEADFSLSCS